jgi:hypothetical protein
MPAKPTALLSTSGTDPKSTTKQILEAELQRVIDATWQHAIDMGTLNAGDTYATTAAGISGVADGVYFRTPSSDGFGLFDYWRRDDAAAVYIGTAPSLAGTESILGQVENVRDGAVAAAESIGVFSDTTIAAAITAGLAAAAEGETFHATGSDVDYVAVFKDVSGVAVEQVRTQTSAFMNALTLFPGRATWLAADRAALSRVLTLDLFGANPEKTYFVKSLFWKDVGTRFGMTISQADDAIGTGATDVSTLSVVSGADVWTTPREISLAASGGSGITATAIIDFTSATAMAMNLSPSDAATFGRRRINPVALQIGAARTADIGARAATALNIRNRASTVSAFAGGTAGNDTQSGTSNTGFGYAAIDALTSGAHNTAMGTSALSAMTGNSFSSAFGSGALQFATGQSNTAVGYQAGYTVNTGEANSLFGFQAGFALTTGGNNLGLGHRALFSCTTASFNTAVGVSALQSFTGTGATALGNEAAFSATSATNLTAIGRRAARSKVSGADETYLGFQAGWSGQVKANNGEGNTGVGAFALGHNTEGDFNAACGRAAGWYGDTASKNAWLGYRCGYGLATGNDNVAAGFYALHNLNVGNRNVFLGSEADAFIPNSSSMTATPVAGAGLEIGAYTYRVSFVLDGVETALSETPKNATTTSGNQQVNLAVIPTYSGPRTCSARRIYRTPVGGENLYYLVGTLADNTTTTFSDTTADGSLAAQPDALNNSIALGYRARVLKSGQMVVGSPDARITEAYIGGGVDDTSPAALTLGSSNASGTNVAGANLRLRAGTSTGTGKPGNLILSAAAAGSSGAAQNATTDWVTLDGRGFLNIVETTAASVPTPAAGSVNLFVEGGSLKFRNSAGTVLTVTAV